MITEYLARIGLDAVPATDPAGLDRLQRAHTQSIAFENLDIQLGRGIRIDSDSVFEKLVRGRRGGYCFEQNRLYREILQALGVTVRPLLARVFLGVPPGVVPPRSHVCLLAELDGAPWLLDVGFGGTYVEPMPLVDGHLAGTGHRLRKIGEIGSLPGEWVLERRSGMPSLADLPVTEEWQLQYCFSLAEVADDDLEEGSHWTSTRPNTLFVNEHVVSITCENGFAAMTGRRLTLHGPQGRETREIEDARDYAVTLRDLFRLDVSDEEAAALPLFGGT